MENQGDSILTVVRVTWSHELLPFKIALDNEGVEYFMADDIDCSVDPFGSNALGGIKIKVRKKDYEKSLKIVEEVRKKAKQEEEGSKIIIGGETYKKILASCEKCSSEKVYIEEMKGFFSAMKRKKHVCNACGNFWKDYNV